MAKPDRFLPPDLDIRDYLLGLPPRWRARAIGMLGPLELETYDRAWSQWAHEGQREPPGGWRTWVIMAGRGFGKTRAGAQWIADRVAAGERLAIALVGASLEDARKIMVEGRSGLIEVAAGWVTDWEPTLGRLSFRTGAQAQLFSGATPAMLRGPEHHLAWCDELAKWEKPQETWDMLQLGLRLGAHPRALVTTTPRPGPVLKGIMADPDTETTRGSTLANPHTSAAYKRRVLSLYAGTRLGRQELDGELLTDTPGALWTVELIERCRLPAVVASPEGARQSSGTESAGPGLLRCARHDDDAQYSPDRNGGGAASPGSRAGSAALTFARTLVAVDPPAGAGTCGIIACAKDRAGIAHVLADHSVTGLSPEGWASAVAAAARVHGTGRVVAEQNQGGRMVGAVLRTADPALKVKLVPATVGKTERATPVAHLFEAGRVVLHGRFPELEAQLLGMIAGGDYEGPGVSPDRADAMVWGLTELMLGKERGAPRIVAL